MIPSIKISKAHEKIQSPRQSRIEVDQTCPNPTSCSTGPRSRSRWTHIVNRSPTGTVRLTNPFLLIPPLHISLTTLLLPFFKFASRASASKSPNLSSFRYLVAHIVQRRYLTMAPSAVVPQPLDFSKVDLKVPKSTFNDNTSPNSIGTKRKIICFSGTRVWAQ